MGFENMNTSTSDSIQDSIQDKIDAKKLEIKDITKESLKKLKVDILNSNSNLRVRDEKGEVVGKLRDNQVADFNGKKITKNGKLFLGIDLQNGKKGFVSADYVKGEVSTDESTDEGTDESTDEGTDESTDEGTDESTDESTDEIVEKKYSNEEIQNYFNIPNLTELNLSIIENGLNLDINKFLSKYINYIENNLTLLDATIKNKIIKSIALKIAELNKIIKERIAWVDEEILEKDLKSEDRQKEIKNQRWIINSELQDLFGEINNKILPSALILSKKVNISSLDNSSGLTLEINNMFAAELTDEGEFDKTWTTGEIIDANTNSWSTIDTTNEKHSDLLKQHGINKIESASLLNEKDSEIESDAFIAYIIYVGTMLVPYAGMATAIPADTVDLLSDKEGITTMLRTTGIIDQDYRMEKGYLDTILGGASIALSLFGLQGIAKGKKLVKAGTMLDRIGVGKLEKGLHKIGGKMGISTENLQKIKNLILNNNKNEEILEGAQSTPVQFFKNPETGTRYTRTLDGKYFNSAGKELKQTPRNIVRVDETDNIKEASKINDGEISKLLKSRRKDINKNYRSYFVGKLNKGETVEATLNKENGGEVIQIVAKNGTYRINGDSKIYESVDEILDKISFKSKRDLLQKQALSKVSKLEEPLKIKKGKYTVSADEIVVNENGILRTLSKKESDIFYRKHGLELVEKKLGVKISEVMKSLSEKFAKAGKEYDKVADQKNGVIKSATLKTGKFLLDQANPLRVITEIKNAKGFSQTIKAILFGNKDKAWIWGDNWGPLNSGVAKMGANGVVAFIWGAGSNAEGEYYDSDNINGANIALNYFELMYLPVLWTGAIELIDIDQLIVD